MKLIILLWVFVSIGGIGNYYAIRHKPFSEKKKWWLKYLVYVLWAGLVLTGIKYIFLFYIWMAFFVCIIASFEIIRFMDFKVIKNYLILIAWFIATYFYISYSLNTESDTWASYFLLVCIFDAFSQISGQLFGRYKFIKSISPNKTLEGYMGGAIITIILAVFVFPSIWQLNFSGIQMALVVTLGATSGDILSSALKRYMGIKDFAKYFPGQGGVLDRYDSHILTGVSYYIFTFVL